MSKGEVVNLCRKVGDGSFVNATAPFPPDMMRAWDQLEDGFVNGIKAAGSVGVPPAMVLGQLEYFKAPTYCPALEETVLPGMPPVMSDAWGTMLTRFSEGVTAARRAGLPEVLIAGTIEANKADILDMMMSPNPEWKL